MSLYTYNPFRASEELTPHQLRQNKMMAWLRVLLRPTKYLTDIFKKYREGANYDLYDNATNYTKGDRVVWNDYAVYEARVATVGVYPTGASLSSTNWRKILDSFIGADERVRYNGQLIIFEYAINRAFRVTAPPYIYVESMAVGVSQTFVRIKVPVAVYTALGPNNTARTARVEGFAEKYTLAGWDISIVSY